MHLRCRIYNEKKDNTENKAEVCYVRSFKGSRIEGSLHQEKWSKIPYFQRISLRSVFARFFEGGWGGGGGGLVESFKYYTSYLRYL